LNFDNGHRQRQNQHNKNRGRNRNNRRPGGGGGQHNTGGNSINRVYESNGPDVKVRGTAQTVAEKYMQLGRDAQSSGDNVMAESYYQFAEHYFRVMQASQPVGQPSQQLRRPDDEEFEDDGTAPAAEGEALAQPVDGEAASGEDQAPDAAQPQNEQRNLRPREGRERFKPRWQNRRDQQDQDPPRSEGNTPDAPAEADGPWEAPSFLTRPAPIASDEAEPQAERRPRGRKPQPREEEPANDGNETAQD
jgi:Domain of unknown function (DUF4167)